MKAELGQIKSQLTAQFEEIDAWRQNAVESEPAEYRPGLTERKPGASSADIEALSQIVEETTGQPLPDDHVALLLLHDGESEEAPDGEEAFAAVTTFPLGLRVLSVEEITKTWKQSVEIAQDLKSRGHIPPDAPVAHDPRLMYSASPPSLTSIPFAGAIGLSYHFYVDLAPGPEGAVGQVIYNASEVDMEVLAPSLRDFLEQYAWALADDRLVLEGEFITTGGESMADALES